MKKLLQKLHTIIALFALLPFPTTSFAAIKAVEPEVERQNTTIYFYNPGDIPPAIPYLAISFVGIPKKGAEESIKKIRADFDEALKKILPILKKTDYEEKMGPLIVSQTEQLLGTGATHVVIEFPRMQKGMMLSK